jgi:hypothetical protein
MFDSVMNDNSGSMTAPPFLHKSMRELDGRYVGPSKTREQHRFPIWLHFRPFATITVCRAARLARCLIRHEN